MTNSRRALVTGGAGFIGSHLTDHLLASQYEVTVIDNLRTGERSQVPRGATFVEGDVRDPAALEVVFDRVPDVVCHLAGQASIRLAWADPAADLSVNVGGTLSILAACRAAGVQRLLYASSMTVYGNPEIIPTPESAAVLPVSHYGVTKYAAERYVHLAGADEDRPMAVTSFRMFNVYGPRQRLDNPYQGVLAIFLGNALRGEPITIHSDGEQSRDFVSVDDVCRAWVASIECPATHGRVFNIGSGRPTTVNTLCDTVLEQFGLERNHRTVSFGPAQPGDIRCSAADTSSIAQAMGWKPAVGLDEGMQATVAWAREAFGL